MKNIEHAWVDAALEELIGQETPPDVTERVLARARGDEEAEEPSSPSPSPFSRLHAAAILLLGIGVVMLIPTAARDRSSGQQASENQDPTALMPLNLRARWEYRGVEAGTGSTIETVTGRLAREGADVYQVLRQDDAGITFAYLALDERGLWEFDAGEHYGQPNPDLSTEPALILPTEVEQDATFTWKAKEPRTIVMDVPMPRAPAFEHRSVVVGLDERVAVPAGKFDAIHIRVTIDSPSWPRVEDRWYARGVGLVKRATKDEKGEERTHELVRFTAGRADTNRDTLLPELLAKNDELAERGMPERVEWVKLAREPLMLSSEFAVATWGEDRVILRLYDGKVSVFDRKKVAAWSTMVAEDNAHTRLEGFIPQVFMTALSGLAGRLFAAERGLDVLGEVRMQNVRFSGMTQERIVESLLSVRDRGRTRELDCFIVMERGAVVEVNVR